MTICGIWKIGPVGFAAMLFLGLGVLTGCAGYEKLAQDTLDKDYTVRGIRWTDGKTTLIFMKAFNDQGKLAICGAYTGSQHADWSSRGDKQYFDTANMYIGEERIGPLSFTNTVPWRGVKWRLQDDEIVVTDTNESANCVRTGKDWKDSYASDPITFKGPKRIRVEI